jgi:MFS family permease
VPEDKKVEVSPWKPLRYPVFRSLWIATVISNIGTWMQDAGAAWLMTTLTTSPLFVALIQAATSFPIFLFALPAGALADIVDRRRYLIAVQSGMLIVAATLASLSFLGLVTPWMLIALTFGLGFGAALNAPAFQATIPELVPAKELQSAVALNSTGTNVSRAVGPALGGLIIASLVL